MENGWRSKRSKAPLITVRVLALVVFHAFFWAGIAFMESDYLKYYTSWAMCLGAVSYTLLIIAHLKEFCFVKRKNDNASGVESSLGDDSSTIILAGGFTPKGMNPYDPAN